MTNLRTPDLASGKKSLPVACHLWMEQAAVVSGNPFSVTMTTNQKHYHYVAQSTSANGDTFTLPFFLDSGTYTLSFLGHTTNVSGQQDVYVDGVNVGTLDWYSASETYNVVKTVASVAVKRGRHTLKSVVNGKNASSSGYNITLTKIWIK